MKLNGSESGSGVFTISIPHPFPKNMKKHLPERRCFVNSIIKKRFQKSPHLISLTNTINRRALAL